MKKKITYLYKFVCIYLKRVRVQINNRYYGHLFC